jgi:glutathione S-transferase
MLKLYGFAKIFRGGHGHTRDLRVLWALAEMGTPYELVGMDQPAHDLNSEHYRALNPFEQIPCIEDDGVVLTESGAILIYLAKKSGNLIPSDPAGEAQVVRWCFAALTTVEGPLFTIGMIDNVMPDCGKSSKDYRDFNVKLAHRWLGGLERWLDGRTWIVTNEFTIADILMSHVMFEATDESLFNDFPSVRAYRERCRARPAWQRTIAAYCERVEAVPPGSASERPRSDVMSPPDRALIAAICPPRMCIAEALPDPAPPLGDRAPDLVR